MSQKLYNENDHSPLLFDTLWMSFDLETTGVDISKDRIVQVGAAYFHQGRCIQKNEALINPEIPIPPESSQVHGVTDEKVKDAPTFAEFAPRLVKHFNGQIFPHLPPPILIGYNLISYDLPLATNEARRIGIDLSIEQTPVIDVITFVRWYLRHKRSLKLTDVIKEFGVALTNAHDAVADARATGELLCKMMQIYQLPRKTKDLVKYHDELRQRLDSEYERYARWLFHDRQTDELCLGQGKHIGLTLNAVDPSYLKFFLTKPEIELPEEVTRLFKERVNQR